MIKLWKQAPRKQFTIPDVSEMVAISPIPFQRMLGRFENDASFECMPQFERKWFTVSFHICNFGYFKGTSIYQLFNLSWMYFYRSSSFIIILRRSLSFCLKGEMMLQGEMTLHFLQWTSCSKTDTNEMSEYNLKVQYRNSVSVERHIQIQDIKYYNTMSFNWTGIEKINDFCYISTKPCVWHG